MAKLSIDGRDFEIAPFKIGSLRRAAPYIDSINARAGALTTIQGLAESTADILAVLSIGLVRIDPTMTAEALEEIVGFDDLPALRDAFMGVLQESGLQSGEAPAPASKPKRAGASTTDSETSSTK